MRISRSFLLVFALLLMRFPAFAQVPARYEIKADIDVKKHTLTAVQDVIYTNPTSRPLSSLYFHIYPHRRYQQQEIRFLYRYAGYFKVNPFPEGFQSGDLRVEKILMADAGVPFRHTGQDRTILEVQLPQPLAPGQAAKIRIFFSVDIPHAYGRFGWHDSIISLNRWYPLLAVCDEEGWHTYPYYLYHHPYFSEASDYRLTLTLSADHVVAATGRQTEQRNNPDGTKTVVFDSDLPVRDFALALSPDYECYELDSGQTKIRSYYLKGDRRRAEEAAEYAASLMRFYGGRFGPYPWKQYSIVPNFLGYGGDQSSCFIFIDTRVYQLPRFLNRYFDFLISHETGHQWFYNLIGSDEYRQMFIDEGMNSFWVLEHLEDKYGSDARVLELPRWLQFFVPNFSFRDSTAFRYRYMAKSGLDRPVIGELSSFHEPSSIFAITYGKGAAILDMLRSQIGSQAFDATMRRYTSEFRFRNVHLNDLKMLAEEESGQQLGWFFDQWLTTSAVCDYAVESVSKDAVLVRKRGALTMPVSTRIVFADGSEKMDRYSGQEEEHLIPTEGKSVAGVEVDPQSAITLDIDRVNNHWPRKTFFEPVPLYTSAHELAIVLPKDSYNVVAGPSIGGSSCGLAASAQKPLEGIVRLSSVYDFNGKAWDSRLGYEYPNLFNKQCAAGFEIFDYDSSKPGFDTSGGKLYLRRELWPASYGVFDSNDHVTLYLLRDKKMRSAGGFYGKEEVRNELYRCDHEAVAGLTGTFGRYGPYPDPVYGWKMIPTQEFGGHFLGGRTSFWRSSLEWDAYRPVILRRGHTAAVKLKGGWGESSDKSLFQLGGPEGLRGYQAKTVEGAHMLLTSMEYRFPLVRGLRRNLLWNSATLDTIQGVGFVDIGRAWYASFSDADFKKDIGVGLRFHFDLIAFLEKAVVRIDVAMPVNDDRDDPRLWVGLSQSF